MQHPGFFQREGPYPLKVIAEATGAELFQICDGKKEIDDLLFAWTVCKHTKSNAIVYAREGQTVGVGAGQMSRVDSVKIGAMRAQLPVAGSVVASAGFDALVIATGAAPIRLPTACGRAMPTNQPKTSLRGRRRLAAGFSQSRSVAAIAR